MEHSKSQVRSVARSLLANTLGQRERVASDFRGTKVKRSKSNRPKAFGSNHSETFVRRSLSLRRARGQTQPPEDTLKRKKGHAQHLPLNKTGSSIKL